MTPLMTKLSLIFQTVFSGDSNDDDAVLQWSRLGDNDAVSETSSVSSGSYNHSSSSSQIPMV